MLNLEMMRRNWQSIMHFNRKECTMDDVRREANRILADEQQADILFNALFIEVEPGPEVEEDICGPLSLS